MDDGPRPADTYDLRDIGVSDGPPSLAFDTLVSLAARSLCAPFGLLAIVDHDLGVVRTRARYGFEADGDEARFLPLGLSFTETVISTGACLAIPDTRRHPKTARHPFIAEMGVRSLIAAPVMCPADHVVGSLVVQDRLPRIWTEADKRALTDCAFLCSQNILLRAALWTLSTVARKIAPTPSAD